MVYRLLAVGIVAFWVLMGTLLVRTELFPERGGSLPVPPEYVGRFIFRHEQPSDLMLYNQKRRLDGNFHVQPRRVFGPDGKTLTGSLLNLSGNFLLMLPAMPAQRVIFRGDLEMDDRDQIRRLEFSVSLHEPKQNMPGVTLHLDGSPTENRWHYRVEQGSTTLREGRGTPEEVLEKLELRPYGLDPRTLSHLGPQSSAVTLTAHRGVLRVNDEEIESFVVTIHQGEGMETTIYVSQFGQILAAKTFLGYDLYDETLAP